MNMRALCVYGSAALWATSGAALAVDHVFLPVELAAPSGGGSYRLMGQSAFFVVQSAGSTSGGQLDGVESPGGVLEFDEVFPPPSLSDYLRFGYFGLIETLDDNGDVTDRSLVMALQSGVGVGQAIGDLFAGRDEATLVGAFQTHDSPEFLGMLDDALVAPFAQGVVEIPPIGRAGETLTLVAFIGGPDGTLGMGVGTLRDITVPAPGAALFGAVSILAAARRRR